MAARATFALKSGEWFRRVRFVIFAPDSHAQPCALSGRNSTYRPDRNCGTISLRAGASLESVGTILRHRSASTAAIYAKVDVAMLESVAQPWLGDVSCWAV